MHQPVPSHRQPLSGNDAGNPAKSSFDRHLGVS